MTDYLIQAIYQTLVEYGEPVLSTPQSLEVVLARLSRSSPRELEAIVAAVKHGAVRDLWERPETDIIVLAGSLGQRSRLPLHTARWSLDIWKKALHYYKLGQPPPTSQVDQLRDVLNEKLEIGPGRRAIAATILITLVGTIAGMLPGILVAQGVRRDNAQAIKVRQMVERHEPLGTRMTLNEFAAWIGALGGLGGMLGTGMGWLAGGFQRTNAVRVLAGIIGALWAFDGAIFGAAYGGILGTLFGGMIASALFTYVAALLGPFAIVLFLKPLAWFVLPHFS